MEIKSVLLPFFLGAWLLTTALVDFIVVPSAFRMSGSIGADLGMYLFNIFNQWELAFAVIISGLSISPRGRWPKVQIVLVSLLLSLAVLYNLYLTPTIAKLSLWLKASSYELKAQGIDLLTVQESHSRYHRAYIILDTLKMCLIIAFTLVLAFPSKEKSKGSEL